MNAHGLKSKMSEFADPALEANSWANELARGNGVKSVLAAARETDVTATRISKKEMIPMIEKAANGPAVPLAATATNFAEAPVSWNTKYVSPQGFECQLTLRGESAGEVLRIANTMMEKMLAGGAHPIVGYSSIRSNGNGGSNNHAAVPPAVTPPPQAAAELLALMAAAGVKPSAPVAAPPAAVFCSLHPAEQMKRHEKQAGDKVQIWYSHKLADGSWCRGS